MPTRFRTSLFERVVCGVDRSEAGATAVRAAALAYSEGCELVDDARCSVLVRTGD